MLETSKHSSYLFFFHYLCCMEIFIEVGCLWLELESESTLMHHMIFFRVFFFCVNGDALVLVAMDREYDDSDIEMSRPCVFDMNRKVDDLEIPKILINQLQSGGSLMSVKKKVVLLHVAEMV